MSYFEEVDTWLTAVLLPLEEDEDEEQWFERVTKQIKAKILESYRNGQNAGREPVSRKPENPKDRMRSFWAKRKNGGR